MRSSSTLVVFTLAAHFLGAVACSGDDGADGATGPQGVAGSAGPGTPAISAIAPLNVYLTRSATVTLSGTGTTWGAGATADFGPGIRVTRSTVASPAALIVVVAVDASAATGPRDVFVADGSGRLSFQGGFEVLAPATLEVLGNPTQGSIVVIHAINQDPANLFDATALTDVDGYATYPNFSVEQEFMDDGGSGVSYGVYNVAPRAADIVATLDVGVPVGPQVVTLESGPAGASIQVPSAPGFSIAARTPRALVAGAPAAGALPGPYDSELFTFQSPPGLNVIELAIEAEGPNAAGSNLALIRLPRSGRFADLIEIAPWTLYTTSGDEDSGYLIAWDDSGVAGYSYALSTSVTPAAGVDEATATPNTPATAQELALETAPVIVRHVTLDGDGDARYFTFTIGAEEVGRSLRVYTEAGPGGDSGVDVAVDLRDDANESLFAEGAIDDEYFENVLSGPLLEARTYTVVLTTGTAFDGRAARFQAMLRLE